MRDSLQVPLDAGVRLGMPMPAVPVLRRREGHPVVGLDRLRTQLSGSGRAQAAGQVTELQRRYGNRWVQRALAGGIGHGGREVDAEVEAEISRSRGSGQGLESGIQAQMESALGANFGGVRVHTDGESDHLNREVNAVAFTTGRDIFFSRGAYAPGTSAGKELLAHELTHVVQQGSSSGGAVQGKMTLGEPGDAAEQEAEAVGRQVSQASEVVQQGCSCEGAGECAKCGKKHDNRGGEHARLQMRSAEIQRVPGDGMKPPGDCSWAVYVPLKAAKDAAEALNKSLGACSSNDNCELLAVKIAAVTAEIAARVAIMTKCFKGGDTGHQIQIRDKINMLKNCWEKFSGSGINCPKIIAEKAAKAAALTAALGAAAKATVIEIAEVGTSAIEVVDAIGVAGEAAEAGLTVGEVIEGVLLVLAL